MSGVAVFIFCQPTRGQFTASGCKTAKGGLHRVSGWVQRLWFPLPCSLKVSKCRLEGVFNCSSGMNLTNYQESD